MTLTWSREAVQNFSARKVDGFETDYFKRHCTFVRKVLRQDNDWWYIDEGYEGSGKSTGSIHTALEIAREAFKVTQHVCYEAEELLRLFDDAPRYGCIIPDEAGELAYNREWNSEFNQAIVKGSQQCRDRNLAILFNIPSIDLLDSALRRRFRTLVIYESPNFVRGRSMWHAPAPRRYGKKSDPYWDLRWVYYFLDLPPRRREEYKKIKTARGQERMAKYAEILRRQREKEQDVDPRKIIENIKRLGQSEKKDLLSTRGTYSRDRIRLKYGIGENLARVVVAGLSMSNPDEAARA